MILHCKEGKKYYADNNPRAAFFVLLYASFVSQVCLHPPWDDRAVFHVPAKSSARRQQTKPMRQKATGLLLYYTARYMQKTVKTRQHVHSNPMAGQAEMLPPPTTSMVLPLGRAEPPQSTYRKIKRKIGTQNAGNASRGFERICVTLRSKSRQPLWNTVRRTEQ